MAYFGGLGAGKGWLRFAFVVEPELLREVLMAVNPALVITNSRVPTEYKSTSLGDYITAHSQYVDAMLESADSARKGSMGIYMGLAASIDRFRSTACPDIRYKRMETDEPVVTVRPLTLYFDAERGQLYTNAMSDLFFGAELNFPRVISLDRDNHEVLYETSQFDTYGIFEAMKVRLQKATRPCKIRSPARVHRTAIRLSNEMQERMQHHPGLLAAGLKLV